MKIRQILLFTSVLALVVLAGCRDGAGDVNGNPLSSEGSGAPTLAKFPATMKLLIFGGTSGVGLETVRLALSRGHEVTSIARRPERMPIENDLLTNLAGDITKPQTYGEFIGAYDAVVSAIGLGPGRDPITVYSKGIRSVLEELDKSDRNNRIITITGIGAGDSKGHGGFFYDRILNPLMLEEDYKDKTRQENILRQSNTNWLIVRPGFLNDDEAMNSYSVLTSMEGVTSGDISRKDVAHFLLATLEQDLYIKETVFLSN